MRRYFAILIAGMLTALGVTWWWVVVAPLAFLDPEYPAWLAKQRMLEDCDLGRLIVVGDSRAAVDIIPAALPVRSANLAVGGGSPIEAYVAVSRALSCSRPPQRVIISLDATHFTEPDLFWERSVRFGFIDAADLTDLQRASDRLHDQTLYQLRTGGLPAWVRRTLYVHRFPSVYFNSLLKGGLFLRWWHNRVVLADTIATRGQYFFGTSPGSDVVAAEGHLQRFVPLRILDDYFDRMIALLASRGIEADFVAMPMNEATSRNIRPAVRAAFTRYLAGYAYRYQNFHVIGDTMPHWPDRCFGDDFSHLNPDGARRFSAAFATWLSSAASRSTEHAERSAIWMVK